MDSLDPTEVLRQRDRLHALRRQSVLRQRRESAAALENMHQRRDSNHSEDAQSHHPDDNEDDDDEDNEDEKPVNGIGTGMMRYQYMTPEDCGDDVRMGAADILEAFKGLSSTHGIPHVSNARGNHSHYVILHCL